MTGRAPSEAHVLYAPLAGMQNFEEWDLVVFNRDIIPEGVTLTIYSSNGEPYPPTTISLARKATQHVDVRTLLPTKAFDGMLGGMRLEYYGPPMAVAAQITIRGFHGVGNLDVPLLEDREFRSATLAALWWEPLSARSYLVLGNSSGESLQVDVLFDSGAKRHIDLHPFATQLEPFLYGPGNGSSEGRISSAQVTHSGAPGALRVAGFSASVSEHFFDTLRFVDTKLSTESALYANGLHLGDTSSHLLVKNVSDTPITVSGRIYPLDRTRSIKPLSIASKSLAGGESGELVLPAMEQLDGAAAKLESSGGPLL